MPARSASPGHVKGARAKAPVQTRSTSRRDARPRWCGPEPDPCPAVRAAVAPDPALQTNRDGNVDPTRQVPAVDRSRWSGASAAVDRDRRDVVDRSDAWIAPAP